MKVCKCGGTVKITEENQTCYIAICDKCGKRTNRCNNKEHAEFCWDNGFVFKTGD